MSITNALVFCLFGAGMIFVPDGLPGYFLPDAYFGVSISGMWVQFMGWVIAAIGGGTIGQRALLLLAKRAQVWGELESDGLMTTDMLRPAMVAGDELLDGPVDPLQRLA